MRYLVNMVYKCKGTLHMKQSQKMRLLAKVGEVISTDEFFDDVQLEGEPESISVEEDE